MFVKTITCSDPREDTSIMGLVGLMNQFTNIEIAVQAAPSKMQPGMQRHAWFDALMYMVRNNSQPLHLAMHVNMEWCDLMCRGQIPDVLREWYYQTYADGTPVIGRWQLNYSGSKTKDIDVAGMARMMAASPEREFILQYDGAPKNMRVIKALERVCPTFSVLYDASSGNGVLPDEYRVSVPGHYTGYSGGLSPENVASQLDKVAAVNPQGIVWIDAEGGLKKPGTKTFDLKRAEDFVNAVYKWNMRHWLDYSKTSGHSY